MPDSTLSNRSRRPRVSIVLCALLVGWLSACASGPPPTDVERGEMALEEGDWRGAQTHFAVALRSNPQNGRALLGQARAQTMGRDPEAALRSLGTLARIDAPYFRASATPAYSDALAAAAKMRLTRKKSEPALAAVRALVKLDPERRGLDRLLGDVLLAEADRLRLRGDRRGAYTLFEEASRVVPHALAGWVGAAEILIEVGKSKNAIQMLKAARTYHPTSGEIRTLSIQALSGR